MTAARYYEPPLRQATIGGATLAWRECGTGARLPLFLMHGIGSNARAWAGQFAVFGSERRVVAWNAPGYAGSDPLQGDWPSPDDYAVAALALLDHLAVEHCVLVGQSLGAIMATALARRAPDRVAALALASPASGYVVPPGAALPEKLQWRIDDVAAFGPAGLAARRADALLTDSASDEARAIVHGAMAEIVPVGYAQAVRLLAMSDLPAAVPALTMPVHILWGAADTITPPASCRSIWSAIPGALATEVPAVGHAFATEAPARFNTAIRSLIDAADAARSA